MIGTRLGHYTVTSHLGTGGMGEVYQATDAKLGRNVAIKILPEAFSRDADRALRFEREAKMLASLNVLNWLEELKQRVPTQSRESPSPVGAVYDLAFLAESRK